MVYIVYLGINLYFVKLVSLGMEMYLVMKNYIVLMYMMERNGVNMC